MARRLGATEEDLARVATGALDGFDPAWRAAFAAAAAITREGGMLSDACFADLSEAWSAAQIVEIVSVVALFNLFNRLAISLEVPVTGSVLRHGVPQ